MEPGNYFKEAGIPVIYIKSPITILNLTYLKNSIMPSVAIKKDQSGDVTIVKKLRD